MSTTHAAPADTEHDTTIGDTTIEGMIAAAHEQITESELRVALRDAGIRPDLAIAVYEDVVDTARRIHADGSLRRADAMLAVAEAREQLKYPPIADAPACPAWCTSGEHTEHKLWQSFTEREVERRGYVACRVHEARDRSPHPAAVLYLAREDLVTADGRIEAGPELAFLEVDGNLFTAFDIEAIRDALTAMHNDMLLMARQAVDK